MTAPFYPISLSRCRIRSCARSANDDRHNWNSSQLQLSGRSHGLIRSARALSFPANVDPEIVALHPCELPKPLPECRDEGLSFRVALGICHQHADPAHCTGLLHPCRQRPRRRAAEQRDELAAPDHSMTSSARANSFVGTSRPSVLAVLRLITSSSLTDCWTGRSAGFSPFKIRPV